MAACSSDTPGRSRPSAVTETMMIALPPRVARLRPVEGRYHVGYPDLGVGSGKVEALGQHADHGERPLVEHQDAPEDVRIRPESGGPGAMTQQRDLVRARAGFLSDEEPPELRRRPQQREQRRRDGGAGKGHGRRPDSTS